MIEIIHGKEEREGGEEKLLLALNFCATSCVVALSKVGQQVSSIKERFTFKFKQKTKSSDFTVTQEIQGIVTTDKCCPARYIHMIPVFWGPGSIRTSSTFQAES